MHFYLKFFTCIFLSFFTGNFTILLLIENMQEILNEIMQLHICYLRITIHILLYKYVHV